MQTRRIPVRLVPIRPAESRPSGSRLTIHNHSMSPVLILAGLLLAGVTIGQGCSSDDSDRAATDARGTSAHQDGSGGVEAGTATHAATGLRVCGQGGACETGSCFNGFCLQECNTEDECEADFFCDADDTKLCHPRTPPLCPCPAPLICVNGYCSAPPDPDEPCGWNMLDPRDGCDEYAACLAPVYIDGILQDKRCRSFPLCPPDGRCPKSTYGAICNASGVLADKKRICLPVLCQTQVDCPLGWMCIRGAMSSSGRCSAGELDHICNSRTGQCKPELMCMSPAEGAMGHCEEEME